MITHLIIMIVLSILYLCWKIYVYSTSIEFNYWSKDEYVEHNKYEWFWVNFHRRIREFKIIIKKYFEWYGFKHIYPIIIAWLIYGGVFIW